MLIFLPNGCVVIKCKFDFWAPLENKIATWLLPIEVNLGEVETPIPLCYGHELGTRAGCAGNGVTAGRTNPYNRARFSDDARAQGKLPQMRNFDKRSNQNKAYLTHMVLRLSPQIWCRIRRQIRYCIRKCVSQLVRIFFIIKNGHQLTKSATALSCTRNVQLNFGVQL